MISRLSTFAKRPGHSSAPPADADYADPENGAMPRQEMNNGDSYQRPVSDPSLEKDFYSEQQGRHQRKHDNRMDQNEKAEQQHQEHKMPRARVKTEGESGRKWFHPGHFLYCCMRSSSRLSMAVNVLWPVVPAAIAVHFACPERHVLVFTLNYIAMVPAANLIGFAGQELGRKLPHVFGVLVETSLGSLVEIILFGVLVSKGLIPVVRAAIVGSILANLLLCLGLCFIAGGFHKQTQKFHEVIGEVGSGLMLVAASALILPTAFTSAVGENVTYTAGIIDDPALEGRVLSISRATAIILLISFFIYVFFNMSSHHSIVTEVLENDEANDRDRHQDLSKMKLTFTECIVALVIAITCVTLIAVALVLQIEPIVEMGVSDAFMGLILIPLVEKLAEHLTAIDEAFDCMPNIALAHITGASIQTALLNTPLVVIIGWGLGESMDLNFKQYEAVVLILGILVVGNFLRDGKSNYLEGALCVAVYIIFAVGAWYYPNEGTGGAEATARRV